MEARANDIPRKQYESFSLVAATSKEKEWLFYKRGKKGTHWNYDFRVRGVRYRGAIPEARTKWQAEQAETKIKQEVFEGRFGLVQSGMIKLDRFIDEIYMPWAKANKDLAERL